ncbi:MAG: hypothetical protein HFH54_04510 [Lachnospiraceae bacterium]|jgi:Predicted membrane protein|nr:hypothetical protein [Lachnospiraceae bacterium]MCI9388934.1 hypothetical protein [Lachnospiraceae bacterium]
MYGYHFFQWILFFFIYCFFGWIWESCYVSAKERKWVNRGFLHGPLIPIYGFGALAVLFAAIPVRDDLVLVYIFGMVGATLLEYVTGAVMEKIFKVRYWDYSGQPLNLNGHICLGASLAWGAFSVLLIRYIHAPVERAVLGMQTDVAEVIVFVAVMAFAVDMTQSFNEAMDLREIIERITENSQELKRIQKRVDVIAAVIDADIQEYKKNLSGHLAVENRMQELSDRICAYLERAKDRSEEAAHGLREEIERVSEEMKKLQESLGRQQKLGPGKDKRYQRSIRLLRRNPGAVSRHYREALEEVMSKNNMISRFKHR